MKISKKQTNKKKKPKKHDKRRHRSPQPAAPRRYVPWPARSCCRWLPRSHRRSCGRHREKRTGRVSGGAGTRIRRGLRDAAAPRTKAPARPRRVFTYCRASGRSCRCPAGTRGKKWRNASVDKLLDPLPPVYNIGHSCDRGRERCPAPRAHARGGRRRGCAGRAPGSALRRAAQNLAIPAPPIIYAGPPPPIG